jgi:hypothetical protein
MFDLAVRFWTFRSNPAASVVPHDRNYSIFHTTLAKADCR